MMTITEKPAANKTTKSSNSFGLEAFCAALPQWAERLQMRVEQSIQAGDQNLGHLEELVLKDTREIQRKAIEEAAQKKADNTPPRCPCCGRLLSRLTKGHARTFETRFGSITIERARGYCKHCRKWRFPADHALGLADSTGYSPSIQEMAALGVSKLPVAEAEKVIERLAGVKIARATLDREAKRQGEQARQLRKEMDEKTQTPEGAAAFSQMELPLDPFTLIIMIDAWNIRERDQWGQSEKLRKKGLEPSRWHWVYNATVFQLPNRAQTAAGRPMILSRGYVSTRWGIDALRAQLHAEAVRRGLHHAREILIIADGAVWIWNLAQDRFAQARQQLDLFHAKQHLWTVAHELHGAGSAQAAAWVQPLLDQLEKGRAARVIRRLEDVLSEVAPASAEVVRRETEYFKNNQHRMNYSLAKKNGEPLGSGAIESTCRQYQCRFKRPGQFWSVEGDESIMCLETFWRNGRWNQLFPHVGDFDPSKN